MFLLAILSVHLLVHTLLIYKMWYIKWFNINLKIFEAPFLFLQIFLNYYSKSIVSTSITSYLMTLFFCHLCFLNSIQKYLIWKRSIWFYFCNGNLCWEYLSLILWEYFAFMSLIIFPTAILTCLFCLYELYQP